MKHIAPAKSRKETMRATPCVLIAAVCSVALLDEPVPAQKANTIKQVVPLVKCADRAAKDQDDICIWVHPLDAALSLIIAADKYAGMLFVYDLDGKTLQSIPTRHPGNIDVRYAFPLGRSKIDIVAFNARSDSSVIIYRIDADKRRLERIDDDNIRTAENYGGTLYRSPMTRKFYFITTSYSGTVEQHELADNGAGKISGKKVRSWKIGLAEAAVGDDELGRIYIGEESKGVWEVGGEPDDPTSGKLVIKCGENGLVGDVEGLAIYPLPNAAGYLLVSNQGANNFKVYRRGTHEYLGAFAIKGAVDSDGLDVCNAALGPKFGKGLFACHTANANCPILVTPWQDIANAVPGLKIDTSWQRPR